LKTKKKNSEVELKNRDEKLQKKIEEERWKEEQMRQVLEQQRQQQEEQQKRIEEQIRLQLEQKEKELLRKKREQELRLKRQQEEKQKMELELERLRLEREQLEKQMQQNEDDMSSVSSVSSHGSSTSKKNEPTKQETNQQQQQQQAEIKPNENQIPSNVNIHQNDDLDLLEGTISDISPEHSEVRQQINDSRDSRREENVLQYKKSHSRDKPHRNMPQRGPIDQVTDEKLDSISSQVIITKRTKKDGCYTYGARVINVVKEGNTLKVKCGSKTLLFDEFISKNEKIELMRLRGLNSAKNVITFMNPSNEAKFGEFNSPSSNIMGF